MPGSLSERFSKLKATTAGSAGKAKRAVSRTVVQAGARQAKTDARRRGNAGGNGGTPAKGGKKGVSIKKGVSNGKGRRGKGPRGKKNGAGDNKKPTQMDLDKDMDTFWYKAGKGKDPNLVALDNDMDEYMKGKGDKTATA